VGVNFHKSSRFLFPNSGIKDELTYPIIYTDLDGTLLDHDTYSWDAAREVLDRVRSSRIPLVFVSSKTRLEIEALRRMLDNKDPFIPENGGAVCVPAASGLEVPASARRIEGYGVIVLGTGIEEMAEKFDRLARDFPIRAFSRMPAAEAAALVGMSREQVRAAQQREYGEAFIFARQDVFLPAFEAAAGRLGLRVTRGGRLFHLLAGNDKGRAVRLLTGLYQEKYGRVATIGVGDAPNDEPLLAAVDLAYQVARPDGSHARLNVPGIARVPGIGPVGFSQAVLDGLARVASLGRV
jgi:mannosyl-3-phosphoglycerate phosphatase